MVRIIGGIGIALLLVSINPSSFCQLRNMSPYAEDRISADRTYFILKNATTASFAWSSEWTQATVQDNEEKHPLFVWHFKDGSKAYSLHGGYFGDLGQGAPYILTNEAGNLENEKKEKVQPMTGTNFPVRIELWIGEDQPVFKPEIPIDAACFEGQKIESGRIYHFSDCK
jgi:hypothetical protein